MKSLMIEQILNIIRFLSQFPWMNFKFHLINHLDLVNHPAPHMTALDGVSTNQGPQFWPHMDAHEKEPQIFV